MKKPFRLALTAKNLSVQILSVVLAIAIWFVVSITVYPNVSGHISDIEIDIPLTTLPSTLQDLQVTAGSGQTLTAYIRGKRYVIGSLSSADFNVSVSLAGVTAPGVYQLPVSVTAKDGSIEVTSFNPQTVTVTFDRFRELDLPIEVSAPNVSPAEGYLLDPPTASPSSVTVSGPESIVKTVARCAVAADFEGELTDTNTVAGNVVLYDSNDNIIENEQLSISATQVNITMPVFKKTELPLSVTFTNVPDTFNLARLKYSIDPATLTIGLPSGTIENIDKLDIGYIDLREVDIGSSFTKNIILPEGYKNIPNVETATIQFSNENLGKQSFSVSNITLKNKPANVEVNVLTSIISNVVLIGPTTAMADITSDDIIAEIDLSGQQNLNPGNSLTMPVTVFVPSNSGVWAYGKYTATIEVTQAAE